MDTVIKAIGEYLGIGTVFIAIILVGVKWMFHGFEKRMARRTEDRMEEYRLMMKGICSGGQLSRATALALKNGHTNGETDKALKEYDDFIIAKETFQSKQTAQNLHGGVGLL